MRKKSASSSAKPAGGPRKAQPAATQAAAARPRNARKPKQITPEQALANTRALLEAKLERAHAPPPYPADDPVHHGKPGFMNESAEATFHERHMAEANNPAIQGHIAANDRSAQIKRDNKE